MPQLKIGSVTHPAGVRRFIVKLPDSLVGTLVRLDDEWGNEEVGVAGDKAEYGVAAVEFMGSTASQMIVKVRDYSYQCTVPYPLPGGDYTKGTFLTLVFAPPSPVPDPEPEPDPEPDPDPIPPPMTEAEFFAIVLAKLDELEALIRQRTA